MIRHNVVMDFLCVLYGIVVAPFQSTPYAQYPTNTNERHSKVEKWVSSMSSRTSGSDK